MGQKGNVVIGFLGTLQDRPDRDRRGRDLMGRGPERWKKYRPTVGLFQQDAFPIARLDLLVDAEPGSEELAELTESDVRSLCPKVKIHRHVLALPSPWDFQEMYGQLYDFASTYAFDLEHEEYFAHVNIYTHVAQICMFLLAESRHIPAKLLQSVPPKQGQQPYNVIDLELSTYDPIAQRFHQRQSENLSELKDGIETQNAQYNRLIAELELVASSTRDPILLLGPTGSGKTELAKRIHHLKHKRNIVKSREAVIVNCAAIPNELVESTLFGHKKGAFTGADRDQKGLMAAADGGLLFLDEIAELDLRAQAKVLRAIEEKRLRPVGAATEESSDFQLVCGTNRDLFALVQRGEFRQDLFSRVSRWMFELPGLGQRPEDVEPNLDRELGEAALACRRNITMNKEARRTFLNFSLSPSAKWLGNFRDLRTAVQRMGTLADGGRITVEVVEAEIERLRQHWARLGGIGAIDLLSNVLAPDQLLQIDLFDRLQLGEVLAVCRTCESLAEAGRKLFGVSRQKKRTQNDSDRLRKYLAQFGVDGADFMKRRDNYDRGIRGGPG